MNEPLAELSPADSKAMLHLVADRIIGAEAELSEADRRLGDGDHGLGMARGMNAAKAALDELADDATVADTFSTMGRAMMSSMGGASGVVFGSLFSAGKKALKEDATFNTAGLAALLASAGETVMKRGGAKVGAKTMLDALIPAAEKAAEIKSLPLNEAAPIVATTGEEGREASKAMIATMGRAKTLGEKSIGHPDAGACSVAIILRTIADFAEGKA